MHQLMLAPEPKLKGRQCRRLLQWLRQHRTIDPMTSWTELGIYRLGARVYDLRRAGFAIRTGEKIVKNRYGEECRVAEYELEG